MVLDPIPQSLPIHFFGSRPQPHTSHQGTHLHTHTYTKTLTHTQSYTYTHTKTLTHTPRRTLTHPHIYVFQALRCSAYLTRGLVRICIVAVCCSMLQHVAVCCSVLHCVADKSNKLYTLTGNDLHCCSVLQHVAVCCTVLQYFALCSRRIERIIHVDW